MVEHVWHVKDPHSTENWKISIQCLVSCVLSCALCLVSWLSNGSVSPPPSNPVTAMPPSSLEVFWVHRVLSASVSLFPVLSSCTQSSCNLSCQDAPSLVALGLVAHRQNQNQNYCQAFFKIVAPWTCLAHILIEETLLRYGRLFPGLR